MAKKDCAEMIEGINEKHRKILEENNKTWQKAIIDGGLDESMSSRNN
jgi:hypothetical protein